MTSPARSNTTWSPTLTPFFRTRPTLCRLARATVTPPMATGSSTAMGVSRPVLPSDISMASRRVTVCSAGNFQATAQRGSAPTLPSACCTSRRSTLSTAPSASYGSAARPAIHAPAAATASSKLSASRLSLLTGKPALARHCRFSQCVARSGARAPPPGKAASSWYATKLRRRSRDATASSRRSEPAAALRGLAKGSSPAATCARFTCAYASFVMYTSPRTSKSEGRPPSPLRVGATLASTPGICSALCVTSSPSAPSPRVAACCRAPPR
mmetsp:Transcript_20026/g.51307  ORF Transcript_20026/g.51307 Transcript_20026/m.51307 type:complete len:270 (+) Transcript_20026:301-1110(+)